VRSKITDKQ